MWSVAGPRGRWLWPPTGARWGMAGSYDTDFTGLAPPLLSNLTLIMRPRGRSRPSVGESSRSEAWTTS